MAGLRDGRAKARIVQRIDRLALGNPGDVKPVGEGISEMRVHFGPGYRVYYAQKGSEIVLLLCGGEKEHAKAGYRTRDAAGGRVEGLTMPLKTYPYDSAEFLDSEGAIQEYILAACEDGSPEEIAHALGVVARARGISDLSRQTGLTRQALYKALSGEGNPEFSTIAKVAKALGLKIKIVPADQEAA